MEMRNEAGKLSGTLLRTLYGLRYVVQRNGGIFLRWCVFAVVIGLVVGAVGAAFHVALERAGETREQYGWLLYLLPLAGVFIAFWYRKADMPLERGTNFRLTSVSGN